MDEPFDILAYLVYLRRRLKMCGAACALAAVMAAGVSLLLPTKFTAVATLLIEAPTGADPRAATAVSPIYLESLKTYERFAASDSVFAKAVDHFRLREEYGAVPIQSLKSRILKVIKPRDTRILEISVTLPDAAKAQACAQYIGEEALDLNRTIARSSDRESIEDAQRQLAAAKQRLHDMEAEVRKQSVAEPVEGLDLNLDDAFETQERLRRQLISLRLDAAEAAARNQPDDSRALEARARALQAQLAAINSDVALKQSTLSERRTRREEMTTRLEIARAAFDAANKRITDLEAANGTRTERLRILDPGIMPQRPSSPNIPLNTVAAVLLALVCCWLYVTVAFHFESKRRARPTRVRAYAGER